MLLIPAIDLKDGQCVRLKQGDMGQATTFSEDPAAMARTWLERGARRLHLVDLPGHGHSRDPHQPLELAGVAIPKGAMVQCIVSSANRDEEAFENSETFDIDRKVVRAPER